MSTNVGYCRQTQAQVKLRYVSGTTVGTSGYTWVQVVDTSGYKRVHLGGVLRDIVDQWPAGAPWP
jgi:hypothetical protein